MIADGVAAEMRAARAGKMPSGQARMRAFPSQLRAKIVQRDGRDFYELEGYASVFDREYEMFDMFGSYGETVDSVSFDKSLAADPDVAFLLNHRGMTMARTNNGTLTVYKDSTGLGMHAFLNAARQDVRDLASAINDKLVDEMSFAFMLNDGAWSDDYEHFTILEADINRGDVSAVNYGASPYTSIEARSAEFMQDLARMPVALAQAAIVRLSSRADIAAQRPAVDVVTPVPAETPPAADAGTETPETMPETPVVPETVRAGYSVDLVSKRFRASSDE
jgi:HK97 family phage prohead protease